MQNDRGGADLIKFSWITVFHTVCSVEKWSGDDSNWKSSLDLECYVDAENEQSILFKRVLFPDSA
jgi:hypothetical protein